MHKQKGSHWLSYLRFYKHITLTNIQKVVMLQNKLLNFSVKEKYSREWIKNVKKNKVLWKWMF